MKMGVFRKLIASVAVLALATALPLGAGASAAQAEDFDAAQSATDALQWVVDQSDGDDVLASDYVQAGDSVSDWTAFDLALAGMASKQGGDAYLSALEEYVSSAYTNDDKLGFSKPTEWHRIALVAQALGADPTEFGTDPEGNPINLVADGVYNWSETDDLFALGTNDSIYALLVLDYCCDDVPAGAKYTASDVVEHLLAIQNDDGSWGLTEGSSDVDLTAMTMHALAAHVDAPHVSSAIDAAIAWLGEQQNADGGFSNSDVANSESCAQVIIALCALGKDPANTPELTQGLCTPVTALMGFVKEDGSFSHEKGGGSDAMATEQAITALLAVVKYQNAGGDIFDTQSPVCADLTRVQPNSATSPFVFVAASLVVLVVVIAIIAVFVRKKRRK